VRRSGPPKAILVTRAQWQVDLQQECAVGGIAPHRPTIPKRDPQAVLAVQHDAVRMTVCLRQLEKQFRLRDAGAVWKHLRDAYEIAAIANDIYTREEAEFLTRAGSLSPERIVGGETGGCSHRSELPCRRTCSWTGCWVTSALRQAGCAQRRLEILVRGGNRLFCVNRRWILTPYRRAKLTPGIWDSGCRGSP
jgi:hypothetical protein